MKVAQWIEKIKTSIWIYPVFYSLIAVVLAVGVSVIDNGYIGNIGPYFPSFLLTSTSRAKSVLDITSSAFISITTFTFSTTMVVLSLYMSEFSPRVVENFLSNKQTMKSFGIFVSGFIYSIICILFIREDNLARPVFSGTIGVVYIIVGLFNFILFINSVGKHIQASNLIERLYEHAHEDIATYTDKMSTFPRITNENKMHPVGAKRIVSPQSGYIQQIDFEKMFSIAQHYEIDIRFGKRMGEFVTNAMSLGEYASRQDQAESEKILHEIQQTVLLGPRRTETQDFSFSIQKIVEVALKSLSPGINDPNTGIFCIHHLGMLVSQLSTMEDGFVVMEEDTKPGRVFRQTYDMDQMLRESFHQIIHYGEADVYVMIGVLKAYQHIFSKATSENQQVVYDHATYLVERLSYDSVEEEMILEIYTMINM